MNLKTLSFLSPYLYIILLFDIFKTNAVPIININAIALKIAKNILKKDKKYSWCIVQLSYAIGISKPLAIYIKTDFGDLEVPEKLYSECTPKNIINDLNLLNTCYEERARFGHFVD